MDHALQQRKCLLTKRDMCLFFVTYSTINILLVETFPHARIFPSNVGKYE